MDSTLAAQSWAWQCPGHQWCQNGYHWILALLGYCLSICSLALVDSCQWQWFSLALCPCWSRCRAEEIHVGLPGPGVVGMEKLLPSHPPCRFAPPPGPVTPPPHHLERDCWWPVLLEHQLLVLLCWGWVLTSTIPVQVVFACWMSQTFTTWVSSTHVPLRITASGWGP